MNLQRSLLSVLAITLLLSACSQAIAIPTATATPTNTPFIPTETLVPPTVTSTATATALPTFIPPLTKSLDTIKHPNLFQEYLGQSDAAVQAKLEAAWQQLFYGN